MSWINDVYIFLTIEWCLNLTPVRVLNSIANTETGTEFKLSFRYYT